MMALFNALPERCLAGGSLHSGLSALQLQVYCFVMYVSPGTTLDLKVRMFFLLLVVEPLLDVKVDRN